MKWIPPILVLGLYTRLLLIIYLNWLIKNISSKINLLRMWSRRRSGSGYCCNTTPILISQLWLHLRIQKSDPMGKSVSLSKMLLHTSSVSILIIPICWWIMEEKLTVHAYVHITKVLLHKYWVSNQCLKIVLWCFLFIFISIGIILIPWNLYLLANYSIVFTKS